MPQDPQSQKTGLLLCSTTTTPVNLAERCALRSEPSHSYLLGEAPDLTLGLEKGKEEG